MTSSETGKKLDLGKAQFYPVDKDEFPGIFYLLSSTQKRIYYIRYRTPDAGQHFERVGREGKPANMTPGKAAAIRELRSQGKELTNRGLRIEKKAAKEAARATREAVQEAIDSRWTLDRLWEDYKACRYPDPAHPAGAEKTNFKLHLGPAFGAMTPDEISTSAVETFKGDLRKAGYRPATVAKITEMLRRLIHHGQGRDYFLEPKVRIRLPKVAQDREPEFLTDDELFRLAVTLRDYEDQGISNLIRLAILTGMRRSELLRLEWEHIDLPRGFLRIVKSKGGSASTIPLSDAARTLLQSIPKEGKLVFPGARGAQRVNVYHHAKVVKATAKLPAAFRMFHGCRHHFASTLASNGVDLYTIAVLLTHKSQQVTSRYAHLADATLRTATNVMGNKWQEMERRCLSIQRMA